MTHARYVNSDIYRRWRTRPGERLGINLVALPSPHHTSCLLHARRRKKEWCKHGLRRRNDNGAGRRRRKTICKLFGASQSKSKSARASYRARRLTTQSKFLEGCLEVRQGIYRRDWIEKIRLCGTMGEERAGQVAGAGGMISRRSESHRDGPPFAHPPATSLTSTTVYHLFGPAGAAANGADFAHPGVRSNKNRVLWKTRNSRTRE